MADLKSSFEQASKAIQGLSERPDNDTLLRLYALYKQGSEGDISGDKPGFSISSAPPSTRPGPSSRAPRRKRRRRNTWIW